ncbi:unnamed protein product [Ambrosiozyma monospora]|uniref:Unnamed protein product n=1 Tax=Ambrosiozyma monospora TaxID=43982 RepID=A0ACB5T180_AMBMO|nr:unnamed protein product [Ambrosiozyma monospora]
MPWRVSCMKLFANLPPVDAGEQMLPEAIENPPLAPVAVDVEEEHGANQQDDERDLYPSLIYQELKRANRELKRSNQELKR